MSERPASVHCSEPPVPYTFGSSRASYIVMSDVVRSISPIRVPGECPWEMLFPFPCLRRRNFSPTLLVCLCFAAVSSSHFALTYLYWCVSGAPSMAGNASAAEPT